MQNSQESKPGGSGFALFTIFLLLLILLNLGVGLTVIPMPELRLANLIVTVLFVVVPIFALFAGAKMSWSWAKGLGCAAAGAVIQVGSHPLAERMPTPLLQGIVTSVGQIGLVCWSLGLGAFLASVLKDKNLILPLAVFLALFDMWLVFVPEGPVGQIARGNQHILQRMAFVVPRVLSVPQGGKAQAMAYIGPADFVFMAMFFVALYRFQMRPKTTFLAMLPVLILYLLVVLVFGNVHFGPISLQALPALLPIGAVVLAVNWREFKLTRDEKLSTVMVAVLGVLIVGWRMWLHWNDSKPQAEPSQRGYALVLPGFPDSHGRAGRDRSPLPPLPAPESTQGRL